MSDTKYLSQLGSALLDHAPLLKEINGQYRLMLTIAPRHTIEVVNLDGNYWTTQSVFVDDDGSTHSHMIAITYGIGLLPGMISHYAAMHAAVMKGND